MARSEDAKIAAAIATARKKMVRSTTAKGKRTAKSSTVVKAPAYVPKKSKRSKAAATSNSRPPKTSKPSGRKFYKPAVEESESSSGEDEMSDEEESSDEESGTVDNQLPEFEWPGTMIFVAKKFSGKTTLMKHIIKPAEFDNIFVITGTGQNGELDSLVESEDFILDDFSDKAIEMLLEHQESIKEETGEYPKTMLIFDDFIGLPFNVHQSPMMKKLATSGRHWNVSLVMSTQHLKSLPPALRQNPEYMMLGINTERAVHDMAEDLAMPKLGRKQFRKELTGIAERHCYEFMIVDERNQRYAVYCAPAPSSASRASEGATVSQ